MVTAGAAEARASYINGRGNNPYAMRQFPKQTPPPKPRDPTADFSVRAGQQAYRTPAPGTAGPLWILPVCAARWSLPVLLGCVCRCLVVICSSGHRLVKHT